MSTCIIPNCRKVAPPSEAFCSDHRDKSPLAASLAKIERKAVAEEREACAKIAEKYRSEWLLAAGFIADEIRARDFLTEIAKVMICKYEALP